MQPLPPIDCDVSALAEADERVLEALVRLQLTARRLGRTVRLCNASAQLVDLLALVGLTDVLPVVSTASGVEVNRQIEEREQIPVDEIVDRGDTSV